MGKHGHVDTHARTVIMLAHTHVPWRGQDVSSETGRCHFCTVQYKTPNRKVRPKLTLDTKTGAISRVLYTTVYKSFSKRDNSFTSLLLYRKKKPRSICSVCSRLKKQNYTTTTKNKNKNKVYKKLSARCSYAARQEQNLTLKLLFEIKGLGASVSSP